ncbi:MAG: DNA-binding protein [Clostridiales bacterium]|nr:DNA-binding protein [Clostridiales bacterium]
MDGHWLCRKCGQQLILQKVVFEYLGHSFSHELPTCPTCGKSMISGELAENKMAEVEATLEDK